MNANSKQPAPTIEQWLHDATTQLKTAEIPTARLDAELLLAHVLGKNRTWLLAYSDEPIADSSLFSGSLRSRGAFVSRRFAENVKPSKSELSAIERANTLLTKRLDRIPLAYLTGHKEFYGRNFIVTPDVLIPRPESEMIIQVLRQLDLLGSPTMHDVGTGSGSLAITIALEFPSAHVSGSDISAEAIEIARKNAKLLDVTDISFRTDSLLTSHHGPYDAIVANLPYVDRDWKRSPETDHEPALALFADDHGLKLITSCIIQASQRICESGYLLLEADPEQHESIITFAKDHQFTHLRTDDYIVTLQR